MSTLTASHLDISIGGKQICQDFNVRIEPGQIWGILGRNGVGKTTLLHSLAGLTTPSSGIIQLNNKNLQSLHRRQIATLMGILLQQSDEAFPASVFETVLTGRHPHIDNWSLESAEDIDLANNAIYTVGLQDLKRRQLNQLSGGEKQRVNIASLIAQDPEIYLLDEPNTHLDLNYQIRILNYFSNLAISQEKCIVMTMHDLNLINHYCTHVIMIFSDGSCLTGDRKQLMTEKNLSSLYHHPILHLKHNNLSLFVPEKL